MSALTVIEKEDREILCFNKKPVLTIIKDPKNPEIIYHGGICLTIKGNLTFTIDGETNFVSRGLNVDTLHDLFKTSLNLNSRLSKQIIDTEAAKSYREKVGRKLDLVNNLHEVQDEIKDRRIKILNDLKSNPNLGIEEKIDLLIQLNDVDDDLRDREEEIINQIKDIEENLM